jgi:hypothetical protein
MGMSGLKWPMTLVRLGGPCLLVVLICLATGSVRSSRSPAAIRLLSDAEMASVVGDAPSQYCLQSYPCSNSFAETTVCAFCESSANRDLCCEVAKGDTNCTYTGGSPACGSGKVRYTKTAFTSAYCGSCTGTQAWSKDGNCDTLEDAKCKLACPVGG